MDKRKNNKHVSLIIIIGFIFIILVIASSPSIAHEFFNRNLIEQNLGDIFTMTSAFFSALAFLLMFLAVYLQKQELKLQREELQATREELKNQTRALNMQQKELNIQAEALTGQLETAKITAQLNVLPIMINDATSKIFLEFNKFNNISKHIDDFEKQIIEVIYLNKPKANTLTTSSIATTNNFLQLLKENENKLIKHHENIYKKIEFASLAYKVIKNIIDNCEELIKYKNMKKDLFEKLSVYSADNSVEQ